MLNLGLLLTSLIGYHEWGADNSYYIFQMEREVITKMMENFSNALSPFVLLPMLGQLLLIFTLFQKSPSRKLTYLGIVMLSALLVFIFLIGAGTYNVKVVLSFIPFIAMVVLTIRHHHHEQRKAISG